MTRRNVVERWKTKVGNCEVTPLVLWPIAKSLIERDERNAPTAVHDSLGIIYHRNEKADVIADCLENQFTSHDLCDENRERRVETRVQALIASVEGTPMGKVRPCDVHKLLNSLKLGIFQEDHWYI
jgi:hypothetical protein